jgi:hypothetical protein
VQTSSVWRGSSLAVLAVATRGRSNLYHFSAAATYAPNERLFFVIDTGIDSNPDSHQSVPPAVALVGVIYTARPGLDLDVGYRGRLSSAAPLQQWLLGSTCRGAL